MANIFLMISGDLRASVRAARGSSHKEKEDEITSVTNRS
jgi:hypothetical protein